MNAKEFENIFNEQLDRCRKVLNVKSDEYSTDDDRLHNFKVAANLQRCSPEKALSGMLAKHIISIYDMCANSDILSYSEDMWNEKITDSINYFILLKALIVDSEKEHLCKQVLNNSGVTNIEKMSPAFVLTEPGQEDDSRISRNPPKNYWMRLQTEEQE